jgi:hypothetical protein
MRHTEFEWTHRSDRDDPISELFYQSNHHNVGR